MNLPDSSFWLALSLNKHKFHPAARNWLDEQTEEDSVHFCRATQQTFLRLLTTARILKEYDALPLTNREAWSVYEGHQRDRRISFAEEPADLELLWKRLTNRGDASNKMWMDAYLAAFAIAGGHTLITTDKGFRQYKDLKVVVLVTG